MVSGRPKAPEGLRDEIEAWVNTALHILHGVPGGPVEAQQSARDRASDAAEASIAYELAEYRAAEAAYKRARAGLHDAIRRALHDGHTAYRLAQVSGLSERHVGRLR